VTFAHVTADLAGMAPDRLSDAAGLGALALAAANAAGLNPTGTPVLRTGPRGVTAAVVCPGGHVALHALPDRGLCFVDVAGTEPVAAQRGIDTIVRRLAARDVRTDQRRRGGPSAGSSAIPLPRSPG
jgi:S-adenosylmethionine/arginine decarboxylase-like enzyme